MNNPELSTVETLIHTSGQSQELFRHCGSCMLSTARDRGDRDAFTLAMNAQRGLDLLNDTGVESTNITEQCREKVAEISRPGFEAWQVAENCRRCIFPAAILSRHQGDSGTMVFDIAKATDFQGRMHVERNV